MENQQDNSSNPPSEQGTIQQGGTYQTDTYSGAYGQNQSDSDGSGKDRYEELPENELPPLTEADTAPMFTDLGMGSEDPYNQGGDEAIDTILHVDTHTAINTAEQRSNSLAYDGEADDLTIDIDADEEIRKLDQESRS
ncbi:hypothetical protein [Tellurirhabdus bombi]|uniref:hypothetical protein n=1 Tax=Tellurirhabdus bombi TaxID=2907205 RepID=UPI001F46D9CA|nr:hypothetical protein [Tellurirhabdus bombi]